MNLPPDPFSTPAPAGFVLESQVGRGLVIHHRRRGMGCMNLFLLGWLTFWTVGCVFLLRSYLNGGQMEDGDPIPLWFVAGFWGVDLAVLGFVLFLFLGRRCYRLDEQQLVSETTFLGRTWSKVIPRSGIARFVQVKDGGTGEDSFPSWGLKVEGSVHATLIFRQPYAVSLWFGRVLAAWAGVPFVEAAK